jgi:hypothetical protein
MPDTTRCAFVMCGVYNDIRSLASSADVEEAAMLDERASVRDWLHLIRAEFEELPDLRLTAPEAQTLWGLDSTTIEALLSALVMAGMLKKTSRGAYVRADAG